MSLENYCSILWKFDNSTKFYLLKVVMDMLQYFFPGVCIKNWRNGYFCLFFTWLINSIMLMIECVPNVLFEYNTKIRHHVHQITTLASCCIFLKLFKIFEIELLNVNCFLFFFVEIWPMQQFYSISSFTELLSVRDYFRLYVIVYDHFTKC